MHVKSSKIHHFADDTSLHKIYHFADDTSLQLRNKSLKKMNALIKSDLALLVPWLRVKTISFDTSKTGILISRPKWKSITKHISFRKIGQRTETTATVKYLDVIYQGMKSDLATTF